MAYKSQAKSKAGNKTRVVKGERRTVVKSGLPHDVAVDEAAELREETGKNHSIYNGSGGTHILEGSTPKKPTRKRKATTSKVEPKAKTTNKPATKKKGKINQGLRVYNDLRAAEKGYCEGDIKTRKEVQEVVDIFVDYQVDIKGLTKKDAKEKAATLRKCKTGK